MIDMINFLKYHGAKIYNGKKIYLNSIPWEKVNFPMSKSEHKKAYYDIKEHRFYKISNGYLEMIREQAKAEKEQIAEWIKEQEAKQAEALATNEAESKEESAKQAKKAERLKVLRERAKAKKDKEGTKGFHSLFLAIYEKFFDDDREALRKTTEAINHGKEEFKRINNNIILDLKANNYLQESIISLISKQLNKVNSFDDLLFYIYTGDFEEMSKDVLSFICKSESETEEQKVNAESKEETSKPLATVGNTEIKSDKTKTRSEAQKQADRKYNESEKGKEANRKYRESDKGKATRANYLKSENGKQAREKANRKYRESEQGQQSQKQAYNKYKDSEKGKQARLKAVKAYRERQKALKQVKEV